MLEKRGRYRFSLGGLMGLVLILALALAALRTQSDLWASGMGLG